MLLMKILNFCPEEKEDKVDADFFELIDSMYKEGDEQ